MKNKGFSLVELIVVIAIMAILVGVAVPVYTSYIGKAQKSKDIQMVDEVKHSLEIANAAGNGFANGYIIFKTDGAPEISDTAIEEYLKSVFGDDLSALELDSDDWEIKAGLLSAALNASGAASLGQSSYLTNSNVTELLGNVQTVTSAAAGLLGSVIKTETGYITALKMALGEEYLDTAANAGVIVKNDDGSYSLKEDSYTSAGENITPSADLQNQLANLMVFTVADELKDAPAEEIQALMISAGENGLSEELQLKYSTAAIMASQYALYKAYAVDTGKTKEFDALNDALISAEGKSDAENALKGFFETNKNDIDAYFMANMDVFLHNSNSIPAIMGGVSSVSGSYIDGETLKAADLFASGEVSGDVNAFVGAAAMAETLTAEQKAALESVTDGVVIFIQGNGSVVVIPAIS